MRILKIPNRANTASHIEKVGRKGLVQALVAEPRACNFGMRHHMSSRNCYGLSRLHHFIYRVYMLRKQIELEQRLLEIKDGLQKANESVPDQS